MNARTQRTIHAAVAAAFLLGLASPALTAQDAVPGEESTPTDGTEAAPAGSIVAEAAAADPAPVEATAPAAAESPETVATIPVDADEPDADNAPRHPYTFAAARMTHVEFEESGLDAFGLEGSILLGDNTYGVLAYTGGESDETNGAETSQYEIGAGYRMALTPTMDLNAGIRMIKAQFKSNDDRDEEIGYRFDAGVRTQVLLPKLEAGAALRYVELGNSSHGFFAGSALYELLPSLSLGAEAVVGNSSTSYSAVGRWAF